MMHYSDSLMLLFLLIMISTLVSAEIFTNPLQMRRALISEANLVKRMEKVMDSLARTEMNMRNQIQAYVSEFPRRC